MTASHLLGLRRVLYVVAGLIVAGACSTPDVHFVETPKVSHCANSQLDAAQGESDFDCGGPDCHACPLGSSCKIETDCEEGQCLAGFCQEPGCDNGTEDSDETGIDCGGSCKPCSDGDPCGEAKDCSSKVCVDDHCAAPACDDGVLNGDEASRDCGGTGCNGCGVGIHCNSALDCELGVCDPDTQKCVLSCSKGTDECDGDNTEPCETNLFTSAKNCGECGHVCDLPHANASCVGGACQIETCKPPYDRCNTDDVDGCETNVSNDAKNCGGCGMECPAVNGTPSCVNGECQITCDPGFGDCDDNPKTGCEASVADVNNCGKCKEVCPDVAGKTSFCAEGVCGATDCPDGLGNCDGLGDDCEQPLTDDIENCGRCGGLCTVSNGTAACTDGQCAVLQCNDGWDNCNKDDPDGGYSDGCEANLLASGDNCGGCGVTCDVSNGGGTCQAGTCVVGSCLPGFDNCNTGAPDGGFSDGCETDTTSDRDNCGGCALPCSPANATGKCVDSICEIDQCDDPYDDCTNADGCETDTSSNVSHCGTCQITCSKTGATAAVCTNSACGAPTCDANHLNCDGTTAADYANGCETARSTSNCGACGQVCMTGAAVHASATACTSGACVPTCNAGWGACGSPQNGCTTQLNATPNCGACAPSGTCSGNTPSCVTTGTAAHCQATITLVNNSVSGGVQGATLNLSQTLQAGFGRLVLVAVAARSIDSVGGGIAQARPNTVTYGGLAMKAFGETTDGGTPVTDGHAHLFYYYLTDSTSPALTGTGARAVVIDGNPAPAPAAIIANVTQWNGVNQTTPLTGGVTGNSTAKDAALSSMVTIGTNGSMIYSLGAAQYASGPSATGSLTTPTPPNPPAQPLLSTQIPAGNNVFWGVAASSAALNAGTYTLGWSYSYDNNSVQYAIVIQPAQGT